SFVESLRTFQYDHATFKIDWALAGPIPWRAPAPVDARTVHLGDSLDDLTTYGAQLAQDRIPARPYMLLGQMSRPDPTRSPAGTETVWAYTHVPRRPRGDAGGDLTGAWDEREAQAFADRVELGAEAGAPGLRKLVTGRHGITPPGLE